MKPLLQARSLGPVFSRGSNPIVSVQGEVLIWKFVFEMEQDVKADNVTAFSAIVAAYTDVKQSLLLRPVRVIPSDELFPSIEEDLTITLADCSVVFSEIQSIFEQSFGYVGVHSNDIKFDKEFVLLVINAVKPRNHFSG